MAKPARPSRVRQQPPEVRWATLTGRTSLSAWFEVNPTARSVVNRRIMSSWSRNRRASRSPSFAIWVRLCWLSVMPLATAPR